MGNKFTNTIWRSQFFFVYTHIDCFFFCLSFFFRGIGVGPHTTHLQREKYGGAKVRNEKSIVIQSPRQKGSEYWSWGLTGALESYSQ